MTSPYLSFQMARLVGRAGCPVIASHYYNGNGQMKSAAKYKRKSTEKVYYRLTYQQVIDWIEYQYNIVINLCGFIDIDYCDNPIKKYTFGLNLQLDPREFNFIQEAFEAAVYKALTIKNNY